MIESQLFAFCAVLLFRYAWLRQINYTFLILLSAACVNIAANSLMGPSDVYLLVIYSSLDALTITLLLKYGDKQRAYQVSLLIVAISIHLTCQIDVRNEWNIIYSNYEMALVLTTLLQLLGGFTDGVVERKRPGHHDRHSTDIYYFSSGNEVVFQCRKRKSI